MYDLKIAGAQIVGANGVHAGDILIRDGKIALLGDGRDVQARETVDAAGLLAFPGLIDSHAHLNDPGFTWREDFPHGSAAAAVGGVTTIVDMPLQNEPALTNAGVFAAKAKALCGRSHVDYAFLGGFVGTNLGDLEGMDRAGAVGYKSFIGPVSPDYKSVDMGAVRRELAEIARLDGLALFHCEDYSVIKAAEAEVGVSRDWRRYLDTRPLSAELISTQSIITLARETGARALICHVSHPEVAELIRRARQDGVKVFGETCAHYLAFTNDDVVREGAIFKCAPPLRDAAARKGLWECVLDGTLSCLGSDHSPCRADEKEMGEKGILGAWGGISGIQTFLQVLYDQGVTRRGFSPTFLARASARTAEIFSLSHAKGSLCPGLDADLVLLDPRREWEVTAASLKYLNPISAFVGLRGRGLPVMTFVRGELVAENGETRGGPGGRLVKRGAAVPFAG